MHSNNPVRKQAQEEMWENERKDGREGKTCELGDRRAEFRSPSWLCDPGQVPFPLWASISSTSTIR